MATQKQAPDWYTDVCDMAPNASRPEFYIAP